MTINQEAKQYVDKGKKLSNKVQKIFTLINAMMPYIRQLIAVIKSKK